MNGARWWYQAENQPHPDGGLRVVVVRYWANPAKSPYDQIVVRHYLDDDGSWVRVPEEGMTGFDAFLPSIADLTQLWHMNRADGLFTDKLSQTEGEPHGPAHEAGGAEARGEARDEDGPEAQGPEDR